MRDADARADAPPNPSRRGLLAGVPLRQDADGPDAALLALCAAFHEEDAAANAPGPEDVREAALDRRWDISDEIQDIPATTEAGRRAKAAVVVVLLLENGAGVSTSGDVVFALATLRDIAGNHVS